MSVIKQVINKYNKMPLWILNLCAPVFYALPESVRYGKAFIKEKQELERIDLLSDSEIAKEKEKSIQKLITYAYNHVPYYRHLFDEKGINPENIKNEEDMKVIPFLTKELLVANRDALISNEFTKDQLIYVTTSGSTGTPTGFYVQNDSHIRDWVYVLHMFKEFGYHADSSCLVLRGKRFKQQDKGCNWQWDAFKRELSINIFNMTESALEEYCKAIEKHKPDFAYGYLSALYTLCKYIDKRSVKLKHHFKGAIAISESIPMEQKQFIERVLNIRVISFYGMSERVIIAGECPDNTEYHVEPLYGVTEIIDENGNRISEPGRVGELVGTSLLNYGMPLIRYKMGDMASWAPEGKCTCGSTKRRLQSVQGRKKNDVLVSKDETLISMASLEVHSRIYDYMFRYQFVQDEIGKVVIKVVPIPGREMKKEELKEIEQVFSDRTTGKIKFTAIMVDSIEPKANGKLSIIDQHLDVLKYME